MNNIGITGEETACRYLEECGYEIIKRNYHSRYGEIDIIARDKDCGDFIFAEVKARSNKSGAKPCEYVDKRKQRKIIKTALVYLGDKADSAGIHFDVIDIIYERGVPMIKHYRDAFMGEYI